MWNAETGEYIGTLVRGSGETFNYYVPVRRIKEWAKRHNIEFIFDANGKPDESKIVLEGLEPDEVKSTWGHSAPKTYIYREESQVEVK